MKSSTLLCAAILVASLRTVAAAPVPVRFAEGVTHGFLVLRATDGAQIAQGELLQSTRGDEIDKRMVFQFKDGSVFDERVTFTERGVYALKSYSLLRRGPAFPNDAEISISPGGPYRVKTKDHAGGTEKVVEGTIELPTDTYNGMILTVVKDLPKGSGEVIHYVAFTPDPKIIQLAIAPVAEQKIKVGDLMKTAVHFVMKPQLGAWLRFFATILGRVPEDFHAWIITDDVPAFVGFEGALTTPGPVWRIELVSPKPPA